MFAFCSRFLGFLEKIFVIVPIPEGGSEQEEKKKVARGFVMGIWIIKSLSSGKRTPVITLR